MHESPRTARWFWTGAALLGGGAATLGAILIVLGFALPLITQGAEGAGDVVLVSFGLVNLFLGGGLIWAGWSGYLGLPAPRLGAPWRWALPFLLGGLVMVIAATLPAQRQASPLFAPLHAGAIVLPALGLLLTGARIAGEKVAFTTRQAAVAMGGGVAAIVVALPLELLGFLFSVIVVVLLAYLIPGGATEVERFAALITSPDISSPEDLLSFQGSPLVLGTWALTLSVVTPFVEELSKALIVWLMGWLWRPRPVLTFLWGMAAGLGFAIVEGVGSGAMGLEGQAGWSLGVVSRILATAMHAATTGLVGLGIGYFFRRRYALLPLTYLIAVVAHGVWNLNAVLAMGGAVVELPAPWQTVVMTTATGVQGLLTLLMLAILLGVPTFLARDPAPSS